MRCGLYHTRTAGRNGHAYSACRECELIKKCSIQRRRAHSPCFCDLVTGRRHLYTELCTGSVDNDEAVRPAGEPRRGDTVTKVWETF